MRTGRWTSRRRRPQVLSCGSPGVVRLRIPVALLLALLVVAAIPAAAWEQVVDVPGLKVERRAYAGSELQEIRGTTELQASLNATMALLRDAPFNSHWVYRSGGAKILQQDGYEQAYVYGVVDAPWPMRDRDTIVRFDYEQNPETAEVTITIRNFPDFRPETPGLVRVPDFGGFWHLRPLADGQVEVTYQVHGDPGGWVPVWMANYAAVLSVTRTLQNLPGAVARYRDVRSPEVMELGEG